MLEPLIVEANGDYTNGKSRCTEGFRQFHKQKYKGQFVQKHFELVSVEAHKANTRRNPKHPQDDLQLELALEETTMKHK